MAWLSITYSAVGDAEPLTVYAASSMTQVINVLANEYELMTETRVTPVFAASSALAQQIRHGAPADIFISANRHWAQYLVTQGHVHRDAVTNLVSNQLVIISSHRWGSGFNLTDIQDWTHRLADERLAVGQTDVVPVGIYAKEALIFYGLWDRLKVALAPVNNARKALILVEREETPLGIVYKTDAVSSDKVSIVATFPSASHSGIVYPMATLNTRPETLDFALFLQTTHAQVIFKQYGFL
ncbi:molybdate ABC transporter substrate-binding protein [Vibrio ostreicida]|uniref:molybdate ABC transporter substrate-binding protein n=1 Tax=Vibrio ostreicida TaxID=526588 RepID=UPI003B5BD54B